MAINLCRLGGNLSERDDAETGSSFLRQAEKRADRLLVRQLNHRSRSSAIGRNDNYSRRLGPLRAGIRRLEWQFSRHRAKGVSPRQKLPTPVHRKWLRDAHQSESNRSAAIATAREKRLRAPSLFARRSVDW